MSMFSFLYYLFWLWFAIFIFVHLFDLARPRESLLPSSSAHSPVNPKVVRSSVQLRFLRATFRTTGLNVPHDALAAWFARRAHLRGAFKVAYSLGNVASVFGMLVALALLVWTVVRLGTVVAYGRRADTGVRAALGVLKRDAVAITTEGQSISGDMPLHAIIPGVTVPMSHWPLLFIALVMSQVVHEAGHTIAAALEDVPVLSAGLSLTVVFPSAFVGLSHGATQELGPSARLRVASSGAFHNLLFWLFLATATRMHVGTTLWSALGYSDVSLWGRVVSSIEPGSPLEGHLPIGGIVAKIDDDFLSTSDPTADLWTTLLSQPADLQRTHDELGWCTERTWFVDRPAGCCAPLDADSSTNSTGVRQMACFVVFDAGDTERCMDPLPYLSDTTDAPVYARCSATVDCSAAHVCVRPRADQELLRLTVRLPSWEQTGGETEKIVVWNGPRLEILEEVDVTTYSTRLRLLPLPFPVTVDTFFAYLSMINLSLFVFNLLPLAVLDGAHCFDAAFDWVVLRNPNGVSFGDTELASLEGGSAPLSRFDMRHDPRARWKHRLERMLHISSVTLIGLSVLLGWVSAYR